jgi:hypothetical protein
MIIASVVSTNTFPDRRQRNSPRLLVFLMVASLHLLIAAFLVRQSRFSWLRQAENGSAVFLVPAVSAPSKPTEPLKPTAPQSRKPTSDARMPLDTSAPEALEPPAPMFVVPSIIDWDSELQFGVQGSLANGAKEHAYRNLSGLSNAQLARILRNPVTSLDNPFWYDENADKAGPAWFANHCQIVGIIIYCTVKIGHRKPRGDLFKDMRTYLDDRLTDPLP